MSKSNAVVNCDGCSEILHILVDAPVGPSLYYSYSRKKGEKFYCESCKRNIAIESLIGKSKKWWEFWK